MKFGETIKNKRLERRVTLRNFARSLALDPSNWSKVERGAIPPPTDPAQLDTIAAALGMTSEERQSLTDLAAIERFEYPPDLRTEEIMEKMPAFFRAVRGQVFNDEDFHKLVEGVKAIHRGPR